MNFGNIAQAEGLTESERDDIERLAKVHAQTLAKNQLRTMYYLGHQPLKNLGIAVPERYEQLDVACSWASKAVDVLAARSQFTGYSFEDDSVESDLAAIVKANNLPLKYEKAVKSELTHCCVFAALSADAEIGARVLFHSAETACAIWDGAKDRIRCGMALIETAPIGKSTEERPKQVNYYNDTCVIEITRADDKDEWVAVRKPHSMGRPLMEPMAYQPSEARPFGTSRITRHVRAIVDEYMRVQLRKAMSGEVATIIQKYIIGATEDDFEETMYDAAIGHILLLGRDEEGNTPQVGQFSPASMEPHIAQERSLAGAFASATSIPMNTLIADYANPTSGEGVQAANEQLVIEAQALNRSNRLALNNIAMMLMAISKGVPLSELSDEEKSVWAEFANPATPSIASQADAAVKTNSAAPWYSETPMFWEDLGRTPHQVERLMNAKRRMESRNMILQQREQAMEQAQEGGLDDTKNFYRIMSIVKDFNRGAISQQVALRMLQSLGIADEDALGILSAQDGNPEDIEVPEQIAGSGD